MWREARQTKLDQRNVDMFVWMSGFHNPLGLTRDINNCQNIPKDRTAGSMCLIALSRSLICFDHFHRRASIQGTDYIAN